MSNKIPPEKKGLAAGARGTTRPLSNVSPPVSGKKQTSKKAIGAVEPNELTIQLSSEISRLFRSMAQIIDSHTPKADTPVQFLSFDVPIDESLLRAKDPRINLSIRFFKLALHAHFKRNDYLLRDLYKFSNWKMDLDIPTLKEIIKARLLLNQKTITYSTETVPQLDRAYRRLLKHESKRLKEAAIYWQNRRERSSLFVVDFYIAHWNGLVGVVEGLAEVPLLIPNVVGKIRGKDWTHAKLEIARIGYKTNWGNKNAQTMEMGVGLGLTGPLLAISKSSGLISALEKTGKILHIGPRATFFIKALITGTDVAGLIETTYEIKDALKIIRSGNITIDGVTRPATKEEMEAAVESIFFQASSKIVSSSLASTAHSLASNLDGKVRTPEQALIAALEKPIDLRESDIGIPKFSRGIEDKHTSAKGIDEPSRVTQPSLNPTIEIIQSELSILKEKRDIAREERCNAKAMRIKEYTDPKQKAAFDKHRALMKKVKKLDLELRKLQKQEKKRKKLIAEEQNSILRKKLRIGARGMKEEANRLKQLPDYEGLATGSPAFDFVKNQKESNGSLTFRQHFFTTNKRLISTLRVGNVERIASKIKSVCISPKLRNFNGYSYKKFRNNWNNYSRLDGKTNKEKYDFDFPISRSDPSLNFELDIGVDAPKPKNWSQILEKIEADFRRVTHSNAKIIIYFNPKNS